MLVWGLSRQSGAEQPELVDPPDEVQLHVFDPEEHLYDIPHMKHEYGTEDDKKVCNTKRRLRKKVGKGLL